MAEAARVNSRRIGPPTYHAGDGVWVLRPRQGTSDQKVESWWVGPVPVRRTGVARYEVELAGHHAHGAHGEAGTMVWVVRYGFLTRPQF